MICSCDKVNCPCDKLVHPKALNIQAGLENIPRQIAGFPEFRKALLAAIRCKVPLADWRAREMDDLGVMLLEMWAYVCDVLAFYDEVIAHESYLRTARRRPSLRRLVGMLGYIPRPAVAASVKLALLGEGKQPVKVPSGIAFRSGAFDSEPPQVFETTADTVIHSLFNSWELTSVPGQDGAISDASKSELLFDPGTVDLRLDDIALLQDLGGEQTRARKVSDVSEITGKDGNKYKRVTFSGPIDISQIPEKIKISRATQMASLWSMAVLNEDPKASVPGLSGTWLTLDGLYRQIKPGQYIILQNGQELMSSEITQVTEYMMHIISVPDPDNSNKIISVGSPAVRTPVTRLLLDGEFDTSLAASQIIIHYSFVDAGKVTIEESTNINAADSLSLAQIPEKPAGITEPTRFLLEDKNAIGVETTATIHFSFGELKLADGAAWESELSKPVEIYGNVVTATRGETVIGEILGSGDASAANQSFMLKKKPLTYVASPTTGNDSGVVSTLQIYVNGILWAEARSFFGVKPTDEIYIVRQDDEGDSSVIFGDGINGVRLPTGTDNIMANYRHGAGAASPPVGSIIQLAKPIKGIQSVKNPVAAAGGDDAESAENLRYYAPRSALILGRAVSIQDMDAVAAGVGGVRSVYAEWRWHGTRQRPVVQIWYIGEPGIAETISQTLHSVSDPSVPIVVENATGIETHTALDIEIDPRYLDDDVLSAVRKTLMDKGTGLLTPERIGIGQPLFRSRIFKAVTDVPGAISVRRIEWNEAPFSTFAKTPGAGRYFDIEKGSLVLNGKGEDHV